LIEEPIKFIILFVINKLSDEFITFNLQMVKRGEINEQYEENMDEVDGNIKY